MDFLSLVFVALSLSADCFAVALSGSISLRTVSYPEVFRTASAFGFFQFLMPLLGWLLGRTFVDKISAYDHWAAFALLAFVGGRAVWDSLHNGDGGEKATDISHGLTLLTLSIATSIDALAVGLGLALIKVNLVATSLTIGLVAFGVTVTGFALGRKSGRTLGKRAKLIGGIVLIAISLRLLSSGLLS